MSEIIILSCLVLHYLLFSSLLSLIGFSPSFSSITSYHITSHHITSHHIILCCIILYYIILYYIQSYLIVSYLLFFQFRFSSDLLIPIHPFQQITSLISISLSLSLSPLSSFSPVMFPLFSLHLFSLSSLIILSCHLSSPLTLSLFFSLPPSPSLSSLLPSNSLQPYCLSSPLVSPPILFPTVPILSSFLTEQKMFPTESVELRVPINEAPKI